MMLDVRSGESNKAPLESQDAKRLSTRMITTPEDHHES